MCCDHGDHGGVPHVVATMLAGYRELHDAIGFDWGSEGMDVFAHARHAPFGSLLVELGRQVRDGRRPSLAAALGALVGDTPPPGLLVVAIDDDRTSVTGDVFGCVIPGSQQQGGLLLRSGVDDRIEVTVGDRDPAITIEPGAAVLVPVTADWTTPGIAVRALGRTVVVECVERRPSARVLVRSPFACRWSIVDDRGGSWFPTTALHKWDYHGRPWFHAETVELDVPAGSLTITAARSIEHTPRTTTIELGPERSTTVDLAPPRRFDPAASGWFGGDLHVHLNYSGDHVAEPAFAASAQVGEGLHLLNLVAGNLFTARVYDREAFEHHAGTDLPWSTTELVARWGVEFRNDMLGHFHALNPSGPPSRYQTGHERSNEPNDWPPNAHACAELRSLGATVGYTHPVSAPITVSPAPVFSGMPRSTEARELVADAALGLVDSIDLLGPQTLAAGSVALYHRLLNCGIRLAATAGTDTMLSLARCHTFSNPPGWARAYADLGGEPLSVEAWQDAVRHGRTIVTNGPWLTLDVDRCGPGSVLDVATGSVLRIVASCIGEEVTTLSIVGPDGPIRTTDVSTGRASTDVELVVDAPGWIAAVASGPAHPDVLGAEVYAHTSPVYVDVDGTRIGRAADAAWCLDWLDRLDELAANHGSFADVTQRDDLDRILDEARAYYRSLSG